MHFDVYRVPESRDKPRVWLEVIEADSAVEALTEAEALFECDEAHYLSVEEAEGA